MYLLSSMLYDRFIIIDFGCWLYGCKNADTLNRMENKIKNKNRERLEQKDKENILFRYKLYTELDFSFYPSHIVFMLLFFQKYALRIHSTYS